MPQPKIYFLPSGEDKTITALGSAIDRVGKCTMPQTGKSKSLHTK